MGVALRLPNITATDPDGQIAQIRSALVQLTEQLNWAFSSISDGETMEAYREKTSSSSSEISKEEEAKNTFSEIKSLIIKSADIVEAYYKEFGVLLESEGRYMAKSDFGTYYEESSKTLVDKYDSIEGQFTDLQTVVDNLGEVVDKVSNSAVIKMGLLKYVQIGEYEGMPLYGIEIGQRVVDEKTGEEVSNKIAMLTSEGLALYANPKSSNPSAIFKHSTMYIANAEISSSLKVGGYSLGTAKGLTFKWVGR